MRGVSKDLNDAFVVSHSMSKTLIFTGAQFFQLVELNQ